MEKLFPQRVAISQQLLHVVASSGLPCVVDADALNMIAGNSELQPVGKCVFTPHRGEAVRLASAAGLDSGDTNDRYMLAGRLAKHYGATVVLKGAGSLIATANEGTCSVCTYGNCGMATAGMGDTLTGVIAALLAQGIDCDEAATLGVLLHAAAGDVAADQYGSAGLLAGDMADALRSAVNQQLQLCDH